MEAPNSAFGTFRRSGNGTPCTKTAATAPRAGPNRCELCGRPYRVSVCRYKWNVLHYSINYHYIPVLSKRCAKCDEVHPLSLSLCALKLKFNLPETTKCLSRTIFTIPTARFFNCLLAGFGDSHINLAPTTNTRSLNSQISWGPKVVQDPKWNLGQPVHAVWKKKESAMNTTLWSLSLLWCFKKQTYYDSKPVAQLFSHLHAVPFLESQLWL